MSLVFILFLFPLERCLCHRVSCYGNRRPLTAAGVCLPLLPPPFASETKDVGDRSSIVVVVAVVVGGDCGSRASLALNLLLVSSQTSSSSTHSLDLVIPSHLDFPLIVFSDSRSATSASASNRSTRRTSVLITSPSFLAQNSGRRQRKPGSLLPFRHRSL